MFTDSEPTSAIPDAFFRKLLGQIGSAGELKVTIYALWRVGHMDGPFLPLAESDFSTQELGLAAEEIAAALEAACTRGSLLRAEHGGQVLYFVNSAQGQSAAKD